MIRSQVGFQPSSNNSRVVLSEHQYVIISRSESYPKVHVCIVRKEFKNIQVHLIFWKMKNPVLFFLENYTTYSQIIKTHYFGMVPMSTFLGIQIGCLTTPTEHLELSRWPHWEVKSVWWSSFQHRHAQTGTGVQTWAETHTHMHTEWPLFSLESVLRLGNCLPWMLFDISQV